MNIMQTKPLRSYGIDVTQQSLQPIIQKLGITDENGEIKSVKNMSQAEKEILRYIATLEQAKIAMGDLANTIESPSNQMKIFRQQLVETKVAISSLFMGMFANILPYANAFLMVIKEVSKAIADMFGIELSDYNSGIASQEGIYDGIADSADEASDAVKELKRQVLGFDEIHNINENKDNSNISNLTGGIDQRLLDAINGYDNGMDKVRMKATEIRDRIMEWLGFTRDGNGEWKLTEITLGTIIGAIATVSLPIMAFSKFLGIIGSVIGTKGAITTGVGATGLMGTLGLLTLITAGVWTITLVYSSVQAAEQAIDTTTNTLSELTQGSTEATRKFMELAMSGDTASESFKSLTTYIINNAKRNREQIETLEGMKNMYSYASGAAQTYEIQQQVLNNTNENTLKIMNELYSQGLITGDIYWGIADAINGANKEAINFNPTLVDNKDNMIDFKAECEKAKESIKEVSDNTNIFNDNLGILKDKTDFSKSSVDKLIGGLDTLQTSASNSKTQVKNLNNELGLTKSKQITIDIDANTNKFGAKLSNAILGAFGGAFDSIGGGGFRANGGVYSNGSWHDIPQYANGGAPSHGSLVFAGENGPEILGNANGRTEILNQSQIASAIYSAVYSAMSQFGGQSNEIEVHVHTDEGTVVDRINQKTKQTGVCPINIPL